MKSKKKTLETTEQNGNHPLVVSRFQQFRMRPMTRREIKTHPFNPRTITKIQREKLKKNLEAMGLLQPLVWNETTGRLISGHQRLSIMDDLEGNDAYVLDYAVVHLDEKTEAEQMVFFNNQAAMGQWDLPILEDLAVNKGVDLVAAGFDPMDIELMFDRADLSPTFQPESYSQAAQDHLNDFAELDDETTRLRAEKAAEETKMRRLRSDAKLDAQNDTGNYLLVKFRSSEERQRYLLHIDQPHDLSHISGDKVMVASGMSI